MEQVFIEQGDKYIPLQRFDLEAAAASTAFGQSDENEKKSFEVRRHPIVQSIKEVTIESEDDTMAVSDDQASEKTAQDKPATTRASIRKPIKIKDQTDETGQQQSEGITPAINIGNLGHLGPGSRLEQELLGKLKENCPIIEDESTLTIDSVLTLKDGTKRVFPDIELSPYQGELFYYEPKVNTEGKDDGYIGRITLGYQLKRRNNQYNPLLVDIENACLNLKTTKGVVKIYGKVDQKKQKITFEPTGEAVKIAFFNLVSPIESNQCDIDIFYQFKGAHLEKKQTAIYWKKVPHDILIAIEPHHVDIEKPTIDIDKPKPNIDINKPNIGIDKPTIGIDKPIRRGEIRAINYVAPQAVTRAKLPPTIVEGRGRGKLKVETEYVEATYVVRMNKPLSYPFKTNQSLYRGIDGVLESNPFKLNDDFTEFEQVYCNGINRDHVDVYKSLFSRNTFLLFPKKYYIARNENQPCIYSTTFLNEDGVTENERQEISKINFSFTIASTLSDYVLAQMKLALFENGKLDPKISKEDTKKHLFDPDEVLLMFPNDVGANSYPDGDEFIATSSVTQDGHYFNLICETEDLGQASLFITAINGAQERYFNIVSRLKEIHHSAVVELNMNKTIGEFLHWELTDKNIEITNDSYSPCRISSAMLVNDKGDVLVVRDYFRKKGNLNNGSKMTIKFKDLTNRAEFQHPVKVYLDYESIEDITSEFLQEVDQLSSYYRNVVLDLSNIKNKDVNTMVINVTVLSTGYVFTFKRNKEDFNRLIPITIVTKNEVERNTLLQINRKSYNLNGKLIKSDSMEWDYTKGAIIDLSLPKQK